MLMAADDTAKLRGGRSCCRLPAACTHADGYWATG